MLVTLAALLAVLLGLAAPLGLAPTADAATPGKPKVGQCHQLNDRQLARYTDTKTPVACSARHNLQTVAVVTSPTTLVGLSHDELVIRAYDACLPAYNKAAGSRTKLALTAYDLNLFVPTAAQRAAGARWLRCDVVLQQGRKLDTLPRHRLTRPFVRGHLTDDVHRCLTRRLWTTTCDQAHAYRAVKAFTISQDAYPTEDELLGAMNRRCPTGWDIAYPPGKVSWSYGDRVITCYDKTRH